MFNRKRILSLVLVIVFLIATVFANSSVSFAKSGKVKKFKVSSTKVTIQVGKKSTVKVTLKVTKKAKKGFTVKTSNKKIATAKKSGSNVVITGVSAGTSKVTVKTKANKKKKKVIKVTVKASPKKGTSGYDNSISIMTWGGDSKYYKDLGSKNYSPSQLTNQTVAQVYAVAKQYKKIHPEISINLWAKLGDPNQPGTPTWDKEYENFKTKYGKYPDIWGVSDMISDIKKARVADLSIYKNEDSYKAYNPALMNTMNYFGFQAGLPSYAIPWGIWVNKSLATDHGISVPNANWTIDEFTNFVTQADKTTFFGIKCGYSDAAGHDGHGPIDLVNMGVDTINKQIKENGTVDLNNDKVKSLLPYCKQWAESTVDTAMGNDTLDFDIMEESSGYSWSYFCNNRTLVNLEDPWYLTLAVSNDEDAYFKLKSTDWDVYPFPSTNYAGNNVKLVVDPISVHNYARDDGNNTLSTKEKNKLDQTYEFASFWTSNTEAISAIYNQLWTDYDGKQVSAAGDSLPVVGGSAFDNQMNLWYNVPAHNTYKTKAGFQKVVQYFKEGSSWDYIDKCWPYRTTENGETTYTLVEWIYANDKDVSGAWMTEDNWVQCVAERLPSWNTTINNRIKKASQPFHDALKKYYGKTDADMQ